MTFPRLLFVSILAAVPLASGCKEAPPLPHTASFEVGTGNAAFETLGAGATVPLNRGPQGGTHIWFSARVRSLTSPLVLSYSIEDEDGNLVGDEQETMIAEAPDEDGWQTVIGLTAIVDDDVPQGLHVVFRGHIEDDEGREMDATGKAVVKGDQEEGWDGDI